MPVLGCGAQQPRDSWRDEWVRVDLPVRVVQRDADLLAAVFERQDVGHARRCGKRLDARQPGIRDRPQAVVVEAGEGRVVVAAEADDLATASRGLARWCRGQ